MCVFISFELIRENPLSNDPRNPREILVLVLLLDQSSPRTRQPAVQITLRFRTHCSEMPIESRACFALMQLEDGRIAPIQSRKSYGSHDSVFDEVNSRHGIHSALAEHDRLPLNERSTTYILHPMTRWPDHPITSIPRPRRTRAAIRRHKRESSPDRYARSRRANSPDDETSTGSPCPD